MWTRGCCWLWIYFGGLLTPFSISHIGTLFQQILRTGSKAASCDIVQELRGKNMDKKCGQFRKSITAQDERKGLFEVKTAVIAWLWGYQGLHLGPLLLSLQIAKQFAVVVSRIARFEWPKAWDNLFPTLLSHVQSKNPGVIECALGCLHQIFKQLKGRRSAHDQLMFEMVSFVYFLISCRMLWS